ncbi:BnaC07g03560D [Brassica napus]|uniref:(rape) hypothetical protein n=1 Tax=Brassica napus TaxID=3708 RepID=A0A078GIF0_BRANA|nr:unnamed protein product [Brassica napus]CDY25151.1 BnaC07g03560D [Brassica napus]
MTSLYISVGNKVKVDEILREMKENNVKVDSLTMAKAYLRVEELNDPMELMSLYAEAGDSKDVYRIWNLYKKTREQDNDGFLTLNYQWSSGDVLHDHSVSGRVGEDWDESTLEPFHGSVIKKFDLTEKVLGFKEAQNEGDAKEHMSLSLGNKIKHMVGGHTLMADRMWEPCGFEIYDWKYKKQMERFINQGPNVEEILKVKVLQVSDIYSSYGCKETSVTTSLLNGVFSHETYPLADKLYLHVSELEVWHEKIKISNDANICKRLREQVLLRMMSTEKHRKYLRAWKFKFRSKNLIGVCTSRRRYFDPGIIKLFRVILVYSAVSTMRFEGATEICLWAHHSSIRLIRRNEPEIKRLHEMSSSMSLKTSSEMSFILHEIGSETVEGIIGHNCGSFTLELQRNENTPHVWHRWKNIVGKWQAVYVCIMWVLASSQSSNERGLLGLFLMTINEDLYGTKFYSRRLRLHQNYILDYITGRFLMHLWIHIELKKSTETTMIFYKILHDLCHCRRLLEIPIENVQICYT